MGREIITICGSTRFKNEILQVAEELTLQGYIVLLPLIFSHAPENTKQLSVTDTVLLQAIHLDKIRMSNEIVVVNKDQYIGQSTMTEIRYAESHDIPVRYWYPK